ncbi:HAMP domain-containing histidine kinase [Skermanella sp. TT6]|uniref:histidine kinase n=1 Tax=Skermanella cutis TaxID=2775420 RepID=A0ABX7B8W8_9PROT|nr:HAMP domain-containing sensor histidine kinase [Skermanella sp. TT6]QQP90578.1 HAMP domain-containing histidine kinase [Skermanella sp. TT6]
MDLGKIVWTVSFVLLLCSSPMLVFDLIAIQRSVEIASGADIWYDGQLAGDLLRLQVAIRGLPPDVTPESADPAQVDEINLRLDNVFNRINSLPETGSSEWHTRGIRSEEGVADVRRAVDLIDRALPLLASDPAAFRRVADDGVRQAIVVHRRMSLAVVERQNALIGRMQSQVSAFQVKLLGYGVGFVVLLLALGWLMRRHMRSETTLRATNRQLLDLTGNLVAARDAAVRSSEAKSNFLANVSHELRTPLNAILGFSEALMTGIFGRLGERQAEYIGDIHHAGQRLLSLINDILDLAKLEAGKLELREEAVDLVAVAAEAIRDLREAARAAEVRVELEPALGHIGVFADRLRLRQVLDNLLSNAIKFTPADGLIGVSLERPADGRTVIVVTDTGIGIPPDDLARVFQPFEQSDSRHARQAQGTGLGLPLVRQLVERHGGTVRMSSEPGSGTEVVVELPPERALVGAAVPVSRSLS